MTGARSGSGTSISLAGAVGVTDHAAAPRCTDIADPFGLAALGPLASSNRVCDCNGQDLRVEEPRGSLGPVANPRWRWGNGAGRLPGGKPDEGEPHVRFGRGSRKRVCPAPAPYFTAAAVEVSRKPRRAIS